jgi:hypothetical protein
MKLKSLFEVVVAGALLAAASRPAHAWSSPEVVLAAGKTLGADSAPARGGLSFAMTPMWPISDHARFGVSVFADDIGSELGELRDPNNNTSLGTAAFAHRWTWGAAWRGDVDVARAGPWTASASGAWGWWRIEDDLRGTNVASASAVGVGLGGEMRRSIAPAQTLGLIVRWQRLFAQRNSSYRRVQHYASAALEWGWAGARRPR